MSFPDMCCRGLYEKELSHTRFFGDGKTASLHVEMDKNLRPFAHPIWASSVREAEVRNKIPRILPELWFYCLPGTPPELVLTEDMKLLAQFVIFFSFKANRPKTPVHIAQQIF